MNRKELVQALEAKWGVKAVYLGVPSFAYELKCGMGIFIVDRQGVIRNREGREFSAEELLSQPQKETRDETAFIDMSELKVEGYVVELPFTGHTVTSLKNLVNVLASKQQLLVSALGLSHPLMDKSLAVDLDQIPIVDMEVFRATWSELDRACCLGLELNFEKQTLALKLLKDNLTIDEKTAFRDLAVCMTENAKKLKYSSFKPAQEDNPKYAMRTWLLRLGMNGEKYKKTRKVLLDKLSGNTAFRTPVKSPPDLAKGKTAGE